LYNCGVKTSNITQYASGVCAYVAPSTYLAYIVGSSGSNVTLSYQFYSSSDCLSGGTGVVFVGSVPSGVCTLFNGQYITVTSTPTYGSPPATLVAGNLQVYERFSPLTFTRSHIVCRFYADLHCTVPYKVTSSPKQTTTSRACFASTDGVTSYSYKYASLNTVESWNQM